MQGLGCAGSEREFGGGERSFAAASGGVGAVAVGGAVAAAKDGWVRGWAVCSHFISFLLSLGCETRRCQRTAWKDSVWADTVSPERLGTRMQASATWRVYPPSRPTIPAMVAPVRRASLRLSTMLALM